MNFFPVTQAHDTDGFKFSFRLYFTIAVFCLPVLLGFLYVYCYGVNVPYWDEWVMVSLLRHYHAHTLTFNDLFAQCNEHRMFFPKLVMVGILLASNFNVVVEMYATQLLFLGMLIALVCVLARKFKLKETFVYLPLFSFLIFSFGQNQNMLMGYQLCFVMVAFFSLLTFYFIERVNCDSETSQKTAHFILAASCATIASFSSGMGLLTWIVSGAQLFINYGTKKIKLIVIWLLLALCEVAIYFTGYVKASAHPSLLTVLSSPVLFIKYCLVAIGSVLVAAPGWSEWMGLFTILLLLVPVIYTLKGEIKLPRISFWMALILFGLGTIMVIAIGRFGLGVGQARSSRYVTISTFIYIGLLGILLEQAIVLKNAFAGKAKNIFVVLLLVGIIWNFFDGLKTGSGEKRDREYAAYVLTDFENQPDQVIAKSIHPSADYVKSEAPFLKDKQYSVFANANTDLRNMKRQSGAAFVGFDKSSVSIITPDGPKKYLSITGWAFDKEANTLAKGVYIDINGKFYPAYYGKNTPSAENCFNDSKFRYSSFEKIIPLDNFADGRYMISLKVLKKGNSYLDAPYNKVVFIKKGPGGEII